MNNNLFKFSLTWATRLGWGHAMGITGQCAADLKIIIFIHLSIIFNYLIVGLSRRHYRPMCRGSENNYLLSTYFAYLSFSINVYLSMGLGHELYRPTSSRSGKKYCMYLSIFYLSLYLFINLSMQLFIHSLFHWSINPSNYLSIQLSIYAYATINPFNFLSIQLSINSIISFDYLCT